MSEMGAVDAPSAPAWRADSDSSTAAKTGIEQRNGEVPDTLLFLPNNTYTPLYVRVRRIQAGRGWQGRGGGGSKLIEDSKTKINTKNEDPSRFKTLDSRMAILVCRTNQTRRFLQVQEPSNKNDDIRIPSSGAIPAYRWHAYR